MHVKRETWLLFGVCGNAGAESVGAAESLPGFYRGANVEGALGKPTVEPPSAEFHETEADPWQMQDRWHSTAEQREPGFHWLGDGGVSCTAQRLLLCLIIRAAHHLHASCLYCRPAPILLLHHHISRRLAEHAAQPYAGQPPSSKPVNMTQCGRTASLLAVHAGPVALPPAAPRPYG